MDFLNLIGALSGCSSIVGFLAVVVRLGEWKARLEERVANHGKHLETVEGKQNAAALLLNKNNELLAEIKVKVDLMYEGKNKRGRHD